MLTPNERLEPIANAMHPSLIVTQSKKARQERGWKGSAVPPLDSGAISGGLSGWNITIAHLAAIECVTKQVAAAHRARTDGPLGRHAAIWHCEPRALSPPRAKWIFKTVRLWIARGQKRSLASHTRLAKRNWWSNADTVPPPPRVCSNLARPPPPGKKYFSPSFCWRSAFCMLDRWIYFSVDCWLHVWHFFNLCTARATAAEFIFMAALSASASTVLCWCMLCRQVGEASVICCGF